jgi:hypothetical protein
MTELAIDEVAVNPLPNLTHEIPDLDPELEQILALALEKDPARRPTAAAMGHALDKWCQSQNELGTPDRLQEHLHSIFPASYKPRSYTGDNDTVFSALRSTPGVMMKTWWKKVRDAIGTEKAS